MRHGERHVWHPSATIPSIGTAVGELGGHERERGDEGGRELVGEARILPVVHGRASLTDTTPDGVLPDTPAIGVERSVYLPMRLLDTSIGARGVGEGERRSRRPGEAELAVPEELLGEGRWQTLALQRPPEATHLLLVIAPEHRGL